MQYRKDTKGGAELSILGFGCMRLPGGLGRIDRRKSEELLLEAFRRGVNYYDTAWLYPGSEEAIGEIFAQNGIREKLHIATKLPHIMCRTQADFDRYFADHQKRLRSEYLDYYLIHNVSSLQQWRDLQNIGIEDWIARRKARGEIRRIGFSYHGSEADFLALLDAYDWDFVQIQYNYINTHYQAGEAGLRRAAEKGLPVIIMEPLLGGKLATGLPKTATEAMKAAKPDSTPVAWALDWLWNQPEVTVVLSGMSTKEQLEENLLLAEKARPGMFGASEEQVIARTLEAFNASYKVRCTGCNYCMPCPQNINIPACFTAYNASYAMGRLAGETQYLNATGIIGDYGRMASDCIGCGKCEKHCPQGIAIREELRNVKRRLEFPGIKIVGRLARTIMRKM